MPWKNYKKPAFHKRHYEFVARILRESEADAATVYKFAWGFAEDNPLFNWSKFNDACKGSKEA